MRPVYSHNPYMTEIMAIIADINKHVVYSISSIEYMFTILC